MAKLHQVNSSDNLLRWLHPGQFDWDEKRPTSAAFKDDEMSVDILCLTTIEESYERAKKIGKNAVVSIPGKLVIEKGLEVKNERSNMRVKTLCCFKLHLFSQIKMIF